MTLKRTRMQSGNDTRWGRGQKARCAVSDNSREEVQEDCDLDVGPRVWEIRGMTRREWDMLPNSQRYGPPPPKRRATSPQGSARGAPRRRENAPAVRKSSPFVDTLCKGLKEVRDSMSARAISCYQSHNEHLENTPTKEATPKKRKPAAVSIDIDGTLFNIEKRMALAKNPKANFTSEDWDIVLDGANYTLDTPIPGALEWCEYLVGKGYQLIYLSGRRHHTLEHTKEQFERHGFPDGMFYHRPKGTISSDYKYNTLRDLKSRFYIKAHVGDRAEDDSLGALRAGVRPVFCQPNQWFSVEEIEGGLAHTLEGYTPETTNPRKFQAALSRLRRSRYWKDSYTRIVPKHLARKAPKAEEVKTAGDTPRVD